MQIHVNARTFINIQIKFNTIYKRQENFANITMTDITIGLELNKSAVYVIILCLFINIVIIIDMNQDGKSKICIFHQCLFHQPHGNYFRKLFLSFINVEELLKQS